ncbi:class I SAM-dependent methyltransferase [Bradyrhizobium sp. 150]|uniref:class I SAM-dependent methyltransferase n=1 Tax=Bradyrhizobium sp. 150 TaxID=2782625 RepID=UPI001FF929FE|nr:class I SAM-dependent methyltransferase [Bradyrhizobium sp. 150]MCK1670295.1 class I SAM-dependent methyltransferase [Bradyrhizobium sp. 150]
MPAYEKPRIAQDEHEISAFCDIVRGEGARQYLEIGSHFGGSLWRVARSLPVGSRIVSVDMPGGTKKWAASSESLKTCAAELQRLGYDVHVIWGNSQSRDVIRKVELLGPYDAIMLDADHRLAGVTADFENYSPMSTSIVAFHDISWRRAPDWGDGTRIDVPEFWSSIKNGYRHREIRLCPTGKNNGIGVLWKT